MKKELNQKTLDELSFMRDWNLAIVDFLVKNEYGELFKEFHQIISDTFDRTDLRGMRMMYNDTNEMARGLSQDKLSELNQILREKFDFDLYKDNHQVLAKIDLIVQRGHWENDDEFRLLFNRIDEIYTDNSKKEEVKTLENLMADYERSETTHIENM